MYFENNQCYEAEELAEAALDRVSGKPDLYQIRSITLVRVRRCTNDANGEFQELYSKVSIEELPKVRASVQAM